MPVKHFHRFVFSIAIIVYFITAYNSHGYYHADEQYQIVEFAGLKLGTHEKSELAWEYKENIRPALQPAICFAIFKVLNFIDLEDPYTRVFILRLISALLILLIIRFFIKTSSNYIKPEYIKFYIVLSYFLWFLPVLNIRFSSESWAGMTFLLAVGVIQTQHIKKPLQYLIVGGLLGLSFLFRFQMACIYLGLIPWLIIVKKEKANSIFLLVVSMLAVISMGILIDCWFYEKLVLTFWNYFNVNILNNMASGFGTSPWYDYLYYILKYPTYPLGILILLSLLLVIIKAPKNIMVWCIVPFLIIHSIIAHKEERFLFPIINFIPLILVLAYQEIKQVNFFQRKLPTPLRIVFLFIFIGLISINTGGLAAMSFKSAGIGRMEISRYIHQKYKNTPVQLIYCSWSSPANPWHGLPAKFYTEKNVVEVRITSLCDLKDSLLKSNAVNLLVTRKVELANAECLQRLTAMDPKFERQSIPKWIEKINTYYEGVNDDDILLLYSVERPPYTR